MCSKYSIYYRIMLNLSDWAGQVGPARSTGLRFGYRLICLGDDNFPNRNSLFSYKVCINISTSRYFKSKWKTLTNSFKNKIKNQKWKSAPPHQLKILEECYENAKYHFFFAILSKWTTNESKWFFFFWGYNCYTSYCLKMVLCFFFFFPKIITIFRKGKEVYLPHVTDCNTICYLAFSVNMACSIHVNWKY